MSEFVHAEYLLSLKRDSKRGSRDIFCSALPCALHPDVMYARCYECLIFPTLCMPYKKQALKTPSQRASWDSRNIT